MPHGAHISVSPVRLAENVEHRSGSKKEKAVASSYCLRLGRFFHPFWPGSCHIVNDTPERRMVRTWASYMTRGRISKINFLTAAEKPKLPTI
jgi:hypothetical protein